VARAQQEFHRLAHAAIAQDQYTQLHGWPASVR
jgi:hypothetical protein